MYEFKIKVDFSREIPLIFRPTADASHMFKNEVKFTQSVPDVKALVWFLESSPPKKHTHTNAHWTFSRKKNPEQNYFNVLVLNHIYKNIIYKAILVIR